jgi:hypothetical protein
MPTNIKLGPDGGPFVEFDEDNGTLIIRVPNDAIDFDTASVSNITDINGIVLGNHNNRHESGGADELSVDGLSGDLADAQDPKTHDNTAHNPNFAEDPHNNTAHSETYITGIDTADGTTELGEAIRYVFGNNLLTTDLGGGEIEIDSPPAGITAINPNDAISGEGPSAEQSDAIAIASAFDNAGDQTIARLSHDIALGNGSQTGQTDTNGGQGNVAIGKSAVAESTSGVESIAIGNGATADAEGGIAIGTSSGVDSGDTNPIAIGNGVSSSGTRSVIIGGGSSGGNSSVVIGDGADNGSNVNCVSIGSGTSAASDATAVGASTTATGIPSCAIGRGAEALNDNEGIFGGTESFEVNNWIVPGDFTVNGSKNFEIDHPSDPYNKDLKHGAYEGPVPGGLIYNATVTADSGAVTLKGGLPEYVINNDFGTNWTCHVTASDHFGRGYVDTDAWELVVDKTGQYEVTIFGERTDEKALSRGGARMEKPKGETWDGTPRNYYRDHPLFNPSEHDKIERLETKFEHGEKCDSLPCETAVTEARVTFSDGRRETVAEADLMGVDEGEYPDPDVTTTIEKAKTQRN